MRKTKRRNRLMTVVIESVLLTVVVVLVLGCFPVQELKQPLKVKQDVNYIMYDTSVESLEIEQRNVPRHIVVSRADVNRIPIINYDDLTIRSNLTVAQAESMLKGGLKGLGRYFVDAENNYHINGMFLIGLSRLESNNGLSRIAQDRNNIFSFMAYDNDVNNAKSFKSKSACIDSVAHYLSKAYLSVGGEHYNGLSLDSVNVAYASDSEWSEKIKELIDYEIDKMKGE